MLVRGANEHIVQYELEFDIGRETVFIIGSGIDIRENDDDEASGGDVSGGIESEGEDNLESVDDAEFIAGSVNVVASTGALKLELSIIESMLDVGTPSIDCTLLSTVALKAHVAGSRLDVRLQVTGCKSPLPVILKLPLSRL